MKLEIILQENKKGIWDNKEQSVLAHELIFQRTGFKVENLISGRPFIDQGKDISISHKGDLICVGIIERPYCIGVDVEDIAGEINEIFFLNLAFTESEKEILGDFCIKNGIGIRSGVIIFWSIKEAFFKCLDYDLKPKKINILNIIKDGEIEFDYSDEINSFMNKKGMSLFSARITFNKKHVISRVIMRKNSVSG